MSDRSPLDVALETGTHHGVEWAIRVGGMIGLNGYARIPTPHPLNELWHHKCADEAFHDALGWRGPELTYATQPWVGFDTGGFRDVWPADTPYVGNASPDFVKLLTQNPDPDRIRWTLNFVRQTTLNLCETIAAYGLVAEAETCTCPGGAA